MPDRLTDPEARERHQQQVRDWQAEHKEQVRAAQRRYNARNRAARALACKERRETLQTLTGWSAWLR